MRPAPLLVATALLAGCRARAPTSDVDDYDLMRVRVFEQASRDFGCPLDKITQGPCACVGAMVVEVCGASATYGVSKTSDGDYDAVLSMAALPRPGTRHRR
ncbi:MAG: hypothetical protein ACHREM_01240 [Polyangiales bacterium]